MAFTPNPLALSVPEPEFESWLRDSGYLEIIDQRTTDLHRISTTAPNPAAVATTSAAATNSSSPTEGFLHSLFSLIWTLLSLFTFNPFSKLTTDDFSGDTPPWTAAFFGSSDSYSFPSSPAQVRLRVHENVKRFARNYASLFILLFACSLYQLPIALVGLISCLALWDGFKFAGDRWKLDGYPVLRELLIRIVQCGSCWLIPAVVFKFLLNTMNALVQGYSISNCWHLDIFFEELATSHCLILLLFPLDDKQHLYFTKCGLPQELHSSHVRATAVIMLISNVQLAVFCAVGFSYAVMILHSSFRKLTPAKQPSAKGGHRRIGRR